MHDESPVSLLQGSVGAGSVLLIRRVARKYKSSRIEYDADECDQSLERLPVVKKRNFAEPVNNPNSAFSMTNRFLLLGIDED